MNPTFDVRRRAAREYVKLSAVDQERFDAARKLFVEALRADPSALPHRLRVKRVQGHDRVWELTWAQNGRATFEYGPEQQPGEPHVIWRRIGDHSILSEP
ncbi:MAG: hypothetical protein M3417_12540 [Actinomycetota bacterium]|nr:hypothetical protein [Actinomycetota bacterium]